jgi:hypothetical protein
LEHSWGPPGAPSEDFLQYLHTILEPSEPSPTFSTSTASFAPARFSNGHLHALAALLVNKGKAATWPKYFGACISCRDRGAVLQAWLYHLLGGEASGLEAPASWKSSTSSKRLLTRVETSVAAAAKECAQAAVQLRKLRRLAGAEWLRALAQLGWRMVQEAAVTELTVLGAGWFAPPDAKQPKRVSAPVAAASVSPELRIWKLAEELRAERVHSDEMRIEVEISQRELRRALRREACAAAAVDAKSEWAELQIKMMAQGAQGAPPNKRKQNAPSPSVHPSTHPCHAEEGARAPRSGRRCCARHGAVSQPGRDRVGPGLHSRRGRAAGAREAFTTTAQRSRGRRRRSRGRRRRSAEVDAAAAARRVGDLEVDPLDGGAPARRASRLPLAQAPTVRSGLTRRVAQRGARAAPACFYRPRHGHGAKVQVQSVYVYRCT